MMREVCTHSIENQPKMVGMATNPVQNGESYFSGRQKYSRGRLMGGNLDVNGTDEPSGELPDWNSEIPSSESFNVDDPSWCWVLGIYFNMHECRLFRLRDRSSAILIPIVKKYVETGSAIVTDLWGGYNPLSNHGFVHETVNHKQNYVNPDTGFHTKGVECSWKTAKLRIHCEMQNRKLLQSHLNEVSWRMIRGNDLSDLLPCFLDNVKTLYGQILHMLYYAVGHGRCH